MRKILSQSAKPNISLEEEIETLQVYIKLEALMLDGDFSYELMVDESIRVNEVFIPALLVQPYIENAFKHGLRHKAGAKKLKVHFAKETSQLLRIEIEDNGIGREVAKQFSQKQTHQSFATNANEKRINLLNNEQQGLVGVEVIDLTDNLNNAKGTKVIIKILINADEN